MKRILSTVVIAFFLISTLGGCATNAGTANKTATASGLGALTGGLAGALAGYLKTGNLKGAITGLAIGAVAGGLAGFALGKYEENQVRTRKQVYSEYPEYAKRSTAPAPTIKDLRPELLDTNNHPINSFRAGQTIKMASEYTIVASPEVKNVEVEENNYLVTPDGTKTPDAIRTRLRDVQTVIAEQTIMIPKEILPGRYIHVAIVKIGNQTQQREQTIEVSQD